MYMYVTPTARSMFNANHAEYAVDAADDTCYKSGLEPNPWWKQFLSPSTTITNVVLSGRLTNL